MTRYPKRLRCCFCERELSADILEVAVAENSCAGITVEVAEVYTLKVTTKTLDN